MIDTRKIIAGIAKFNNKKSMKVTGSSLFDYIAKANISVEDKILDKIEDNKTLKNQDSVVLEYFTKLFINTKVENISSKQKVVETVQATLKKNHIPFSVVTYKSIALSAVLKGNKMGDLNLFKTPIEDWDEKLYENVYNAFLVDGKKSS